MNSMSFGGLKQSGIGREQGIEELFFHTRERSITIAPRRGKGGTAS